MGKRNRTGSGTSRWWRNNCRWGSTPWYIRGIATRADKVTAAIVSFHGTQFDKSFAFFITQEIVQDDYPRSKLVVCCFLWITIFVTWTRKYFWLIMLGFSVRRESWCKPGWLQEERWDISNSKRNKLLTKTKSVRKHTFQTFGAYHLVAKLRAHLGPQGIEFQYAGQCNSDTQVHNFVAYKSDSFHILGHNKRKKERRNRKDRRWSEESARVSVVVFSNTMGDSLLTSQHSPKSALLVLIFTYLLHW